MVGSPCPGGVGRERPRYLAALPSGSLPTSPLQVSTRRCPTRLPQSQAQALYAIGGPHPRPHPRLRPRRCLPTPGWLATPVVPPCRWSFCLSSGPLSWAPLCLCLPWSSSWAAHFPGAVYCRCSSPRRHHWHCYPPPSTPARADLVVGCTSPAPSSVLLIVCLSLGSRAQDIRYHLHFLPQLPTRERDRRPPSPWTMRTAASSPASSVV